MKDDVKYSSALSIVRRLTTKGYQAVFAGGYVRDMVLGLPVKGDIDIATNAAPQTIASLFDRVTGVGEHFGVMLVIENGIAFEVATFRSDVGLNDGRHPREVVFTSAEMDAQRRDFTINGLFYNPLTDEIIDYVGGRDDLRAGLVRAIGDPAMRFKEDYLRLLRAIRFAARFGFAIDDATWKAIAAHAHGIGKIAQERIFQELTKMLTGTHADRAFELLSQCGLLAIVLPEVEAMKGIEQPSEFHPEGDVFSHTVKALSFLNEPSAVTAWSTLLHDVGKPATMSRSDRIRFHNHNNIGAQIAGKILERLRAPRLLIDSVSEIVERHMDFINVTKMRLSTLKHFLGRNTFESELELHRVDCLASHGNLDNYNYLQEKRRVFAHEVKPAPLISGKDLIRLGFTPGPLFGRILRVVYDLQLEEKLHSAEEARRWVDENRGSFLT